MHNYKKLVLNRESYLKDKAWDLPDCPDIIPNTFNIVMPFGTTGKKRHYWIWSTEANTGKTTFLQTIMATYRASWYSYEEVFQNIRQGSQFILMDEFTKAHLLSTQINQMCDGTFCYPGKGDTAMQATQTTLLICGNKSPEVIYPNAWQFIRARFNVINLDKGIEPPMFAHFREVSRKQRK